MLKKHQKLALRAVNSSLHKPGLTLPALQNPHLHRMIGEKGAPGHSVPLFVWMAVALQNLRSFFFGGVMKANGVILPYVVEKLQTSHTLVAWAFTLQCALGFLMTPLSKHLLHYFSYRQLGIVGGFLAGFGYIGSGLLTSSILDLFVYHSISGFGFGLLCIPNFMYIHAHVDDQTFAKIQSTTAIFIYVGVAILPVVMKWLIDMYGHSDGLAIFGALIWNCILVGVAMKPTKESTLEIDSTSCSTVPHEKLHYLDKYVPFLSPLFRHRNFAICILFASAGLYVYSSWAIFLVTFGNSLGFSSQQSVYLSTAGGAGGAVGSLLPLVLFSYNKMNAFTACFFPFLANGTILLVTTFINDFIIVLQLMFLSGFVQGFQYAGTCGIIPLLLCEHHLGFGAVLSFLAEGIFYQLGGLIPGILYDATGSVIVIFIVNAVVCITVAPFALVWGCDKRPVNNCYS